MYVSPLASLDSTCTESYSKFGETFAPVTEDHSEDFIKTLIDVASIGYGHAVGPQWVDSLPKGACAHVKLEVECELDHVVSHRYGIKS